MRRVIVMTVLTAILAAFVQLPVSAMDEFDTVRSRRFDYLTAAGSQESYVRNKIGSINASAYYQWQNMNRADDRTYLFAALQDTSKSTQVTQTYNILGIMAQAYCTPGGFLYKNEQMKNDLINALDWMYENRYNKRIREFDNWWDWEIGTPVMLNDIMVMLYEQLGSERIKKYTDVIRYFAPDPKVCAQQMYPFESTAANRVSMCKVAALCGILTKDASRIAEASNALAPVFEYVTQGDGFYADGSFIQHGKLAYTGGYGMGLMSGLTEMIYLLGNTGWDVPASDVLYDWFYDSFLPFTYDGLMMDCVTGRNASRDYNQTYCAATLFDIVVMLADIAPQPICDNLKGIAATWLEQDRLGTLYQQASIFSLSRISELAGTKTVEREEMSRIFPAMDRAVHHRKKYAFAIAMTSERTYNYESIWNENLRGWHTADGMTYLYDEGCVRYTDGFWPTVDANRLAGTTIERKTLADAENAATEGGSAYAGGASVDGYGVACMEYMPGQSSITAKKSWFMFDDEIVALGTDINNKSDYCTETVIDNRMTSANAVLSEGNNWTHISDESETGYYIPDKSNVKTVREIREGAWSDINQACSANVLSREYVTMWFDHGTKPQNAEYAYALLPGMTQAQTAAYAQKPAFEVLENSAEAQAVRQKNANVEAAVFWQDKKHTAGDITCSGKANVAVSEKDGSLSVGISDPTQTQQGRITVEIDRFAADIISCDERIEVLSTYPRIRIAFNAKDSRGMTSAVTFGKIRQPWKTVAALDKAMNAELQKNGEVIISENGTFVFRRWANDSMAYADVPSVGGFDSVFISQKSASEYKDHILIPESMIMRGGVTRLDFDTEVSCAAEGNTASLMLKFNGVVGFMPLTGNLIGKGRQKLTLVIDMQNRVVYSEIDGKRIKTEPMAALPDESALADLRLYTVAKPAAGSFADGMDALNAEVLWEIHSITVSQADSNKLLYIKECGAADERFAAVIRNDAAIPKDAVAYAAVYGEGRLLGVTAVSGEQLMCGEEFTIEEEYNGAGECVIYLWDAYMRPYDIHRIRLSE